MGYVAMFHNHIRSLFDAAWLVSSLGYGIARTVDLSFCQLRRWVRVGRVETNTGLFGSGSNDGQAFGSARVGECAGVSSPSPKSEVNGVAPERTKCIG